LAAERYFYKTNQDKIKFADTKMKELYMTLLMGKTIDIQ